MAMVSAVDEYLSSGRLLYSKRVLMGHPNGDYMAFFDKDKKQLTPWLEVHDLASGKPGWYCEYLATPADNGKTVTQVGIGNPHWNMPPPVMYYNCTSMTMYAGASCTIQFKPA